MLKKFLTFFVVCSLYGCISPPKVVVGVSDPESGGMQTYDQKTEKEGFVPYEQTANWVCHPPEDYKALLEHFKRQCAGKE